jgi:hypothetical protein
MSQNISSASSDEAEVVIGTLDHLIWASTGHHLSPLQALIIRGVWSAATYEDIARQSSWSEAHVKAVGAALWDLLSEILQERISKKNFRTIVERRYSDLCVPERNNGESAGNMATFASTLAFEFPDGPIKLNSTLYCDRPLIESRCYAAITQPGALIRIRAPRHMGKTSLLNRILHHGETLGYVCVSLNLQLVDSDILQNLDRFLQWFCARVTQKLNLPLQLTDYWDDIFGSKTSCKDYFESYLLPSCPQPLILALDEVDTLFNYPTTADGFFALLRAWYEDAKNSELWQTLRLILVHSTDAYVPLNINQSPFNVGMPIELPEFNAEQVKTLIDRHGLNWTSDQVEQLIGLLGGHPYLVRMALYYITQNQTTLDEILTSALNTTSPFYPHLQHFTSLLEQQPDLVNVLKPMLNQQQTIQLKPLDLFQLTRVGLIQVCQGKVQIRCELYRRWLQNYL